MTQIVDVSLLARIRRYGAFDVNACFNCGNCTAVCRLSKDEDTFPRRLIRYGQVGMEDRLLAEKDLWRCYNCGECTRTCPRQAAPGDFMAAARRYAISRYDITGLARLLYGSVWGHVAAFLLLSVLLTLLLLWFKGDMNGQRLALFDFIPGAVVHDLGLVIFGLIGIGLLAGVAIMLVRTHQRSRTTGKPAPVLRALIPAVLSAVGESVGQARYRECDADRVNEPWHARPWFAHAAMLWGFLGMLIATIVDFISKPIGTPLPIYAPVRLLGTLAGLLCMYGVAVVIFRRAHRPDVPYAGSRFSDWFFLLLLGAVVLTGLVTEVVVYLPAPSLFAYLVFLVHVVLAMDLVLLLPVTKFAHAVYRPLALFLHRWQELSRT